MRGGSVTPATSPHQWPGSNGIPEARTLENGPGTRKTSPVFPSTAPICELSQKWLVFLFVRRPVLTGPASLNWRISSRRDHPLSDCQPILRSYRPYDGNFLTSWLNIAILQWDIFEPKSIIWNSSLRAPYENDCLLRAKPWSCFYLLFAIIIIMPRRDYFHSYGDEFVPECDCGGGWAKSWIDTGSSISRGILTSLLSLIPWATCVHYVREHLSNGCFCSHWFLCLESPSLHVWHPNLIGSFRPRSDVFSYSLLWPLIELSKIFLLWHILHCIILMSDFDQSCIRNWLVWGWALGRKHRQENSCPVETTAE